MLYLVSKRNSVADPRLALQTTTEGFFACLETWNILIDFISTSMANRKPDEARRMLQRYSEALLSLVAELVNRIQFRHNRAQLEKLDDTSVDDDVSGMKSRTISIS